MHFIARFPIIVWFLIIALITSASVSYYTYAKVFKSQIEDVRAYEIARIDLRLAQLQGTVNDFNRRQDYNAIHREVSRLASDPTMELVIIVDEHDIIKYSSSLEYRETKLSRQEVFGDISTAGSTNEIKFEILKSVITGVYPLDLHSHTTSDNPDGKAYLFARFDLSSLMNELEYRQQQEIIHITIIHLGLLFIGFLFLYISMNSRIRSIINGISNFSNGVYHSRINLPGKDEFSRISRGFDAMADKLQTQNASLMALTEQLKGQHRDLAQREQDLRVTLNSIGDAVITTDAEGRVTRMNPVAQRIIGWSIEEARGKPIADIFNIIDAGTREIIESPVNKVLKSGKTVYLSNNTTLISRHGAEYQISDSAAPIRNEENEIQGMVLIFNDVTEQYRLRETAAKSERLLRSIMDNSPAIIYVKTSDGVFTYANKRFLVVFNLKADDVIGRKVHEIFPQEIADEMKKNDLQVFSSKQNIEFEEEAPHADGIHTYSSIKFPLMDKTGEVYAVCGISTDITYRKKQEQLMQRSQKMDALGKLTGGIAHDYNNMLGVVIGYSELLKLSLADNETLYKYADEIHLASERGANLSKKLLSFSRPQTGENQVVDVNELLNEQQDMLEKVLTARIKLDLLLDPFVWPVCINGSELIDAIVNISLNAMSAMEQGGVFTIQTHNIALGEFEAKQLDILPGKYIQLVFTDTGTGIDEVTQQKIFEPFFTTKGERGTGLGLSQVYGLVKNNKGSVEVESRVGQGTTIKICLPSFEEKQELAPKKTSIAPENMQGVATVLVVDDESSLRNLVQETLSNYGYHVLTAGNGVEALKVLEVYKVDVLFSDVIMPEMDGYQLARQVREKYPTIKIQLASGYYQHDEIEVDPVLVDNILHKPFTSQELLQCIKRLC